MGRIVLCVFVAIILAFVGLAIYVEITGDDGPAGPHSVTCRQWRTTTVCQ